MDNTDKIKESIKKDLLKNIDKVVNGIYESLNNPSFTSNLEDTAFILEGNPYKELSLSDILTGKTKCPFPNENEENYIEISIDGISKKIKLSNQIFTHLYKFTYKNGMALKDIPIGILNILEVFEIHQGFQKSKDINSRSTAKWLMGITLFGSIRYQNKINSPYITSKEAKSIVKGITRNLKNIYNVINGNSIMIDENNVGITLFNHKSPDKDIKIVEK
jgi:hypothetical protein